ncbi:MAG: thioredoxin family protein [Eubacteriales bacterium]|nr:thioredoxin family protein [Eubacteriales bacterium]
MKDVLMMVMEGCPHCRRAEQLLEELAAQNPAYRSVRIRRVDENQEKELADSLDYYYVPTFFVDGKKRMEGVPTREAVENVLREALK